MTPSPISARDQVTVPTLPPDYDPTTTSTAVPASPADPTAGAPADQLAHLGALVVHWLVVGALVAALAALLLYALTCALWPYRTCPRCHGYSRLVPRRSGRLSLDPPS